MPRTQVSGSRRATRPTGLLLRLSARYGTDDAPRYEQEGGQRWITRCVTGWSFQVHRILR
jgi:hypothetical protein